MPRGSLNGFWSIGLCSGVTLLLSTTRSPGLRRGVITPSRQAGIWRNKPRKQNEDVPPTRVPDRFTPVIRLGLFIYYGFSTISDFMRPSAPSSSPFSRFEAYTRPALAEIVAGLPSPA